MEDRLVRSIASGDPVSCRNPKAMDDFPYPGIGLPTSGGHQMAKENVQFSSNFHN